MWNACVDLLYPAVLDIRLKLIALAVAIPILLLVLYHFFATSWSNRCDPGNQRFYMTDRQLPTRYGRARD